MDQVPLNHSSMNSRGDPPGVTGVVDGAQRPVDDSSLLALVVAAVVPTLRLDVGDTAARRDAELRDQERLMAVVTLELGEIRSERDGPSASRPWAYPGSRFMKSG